MAKQFTTQEMELMESVKSLAESINGSVQAVNGSVQAVETLVNELKNTDVVNLAEKLNKSIAYIGFDENTTDLVVVGENQVWIMGTDIYASSWNLLKFLPNFNGKVRMEFEAYYNRDAYTEKIRVSSNGITQEQVMGLSWKSHVFEIDVVQGEAVTLSTLLYSACGAPQYRMEIRNIKVFGEIMDKPWAVIL